jgi:transcriptional regulator with XRE-family HTH domain
MTTFSVRLEFVLKALSISRGRLGADLAVDKSVVSRWLSGSRAPTSHNMAAITALIGTRVKGFTMLDWELSLDDLAARLGIVEAREEASPIMADEAISFRLVKRSTAETAALGERFIGLWRCTRPAFARTDVFIREHMHIFPVGHRLAVNYFCAHFDWPGWLLMTNQRLDILVEDTDLVHLLLAPPQTPFVYSMDGVVLTSAADDFRTPSASRIFIERVSPWEADDDTMDTLMAEARAAQVTWAWDEIDPDLRSHLNPEIGPTAMRGGGDHILRLPQNVTMGRGGYYPNAATPTISYVKVPPREVAASGSLLGTGQRRK